MSYEDYGSGPIALLIHGSPGNGKAWARVGERLSKRYRVIAPDLPGYGDTTALPLPPYWVKTGEGPPEPVPMCINHPLREREPGTMYCPECVDQQASSWARLSAQEARLKTASLTQVEKR